MELSDKIKEKMQSVNTADQGLNSGVYAPLLPKTADPSSILLSAPSVSVCEKVGWMVLISFTLLISGLIVGIASIKDVYYHNNPGFTEDQLNLAAFIALSLMTIVTYPVGVLLDRIGSKRLNLFGLLLQIIGFLLIGLSTVVVPPALLVSRVNGVPSLLIIGFVFSGLANPAIFSSVIPMAKAFGPAWEEVIISLFTGLWDLATFLSWLFNKVTKIFRGTERITVAALDPGYFFIIISAILVMIAGIAFLIYPNTKQLAQIIQSYNDTHTRGGETEEEEPETNSQEPDKTKKSAMTRVQLAILTVMASSIICCTNFYLANVADICLQLEQGSEKRIDDVISSFSLIFPLAGFLASVMTGFILKRLNRIIGLCGILVTCLLFTVLSDLRHLSVGHLYLVFTLYIILRMSTYSMINSIMISDSKHRNIGRNFGIVYGCAGLINFLNYPLTMVAKKYGVGFTPILITFGCINALSLVAIIMYTIRRTRQSKI